MEVIHTRLVRGCSKSISSLPLYLDLAECPVDLERGYGSNDHEYTHDENPGKQYAGQVRLYSQNYKRNEGNSCNTISFKTVCSRSYAVTCIVSCTVGNNTWVTRVIFFDFKNDLHQVGTDIGDLGEDTAGNTECTGSKGFTNCKTYKACSGQILWNKQQI